MAPAGPVVGGTGAAPLAVPPGLLPPPPPPSSPQRQPSSATGPAPAPASAPAPAAAPEPATLAARLDALLAPGRGAPATPAELGLAEAVCASLWPNWPPYRGPVGAVELRLALRGRAVDAPTLARLGGSASARRADPTTAAGVGAGPPAPGGPDPPPGTPPKPGPPPRPMVRHAVERPPGAGPPPPRPGKGRERERLMLSPEHGLHLARHGPWRP